MHLLPATYSRVPESLSQVSGPELVRSSNFWVRRTCSELQVRETQATRLSGCEEWDIVSVGCHEKPTVCLRLSMGCANPFPGTWYHKEIVLSGGDQVWE